MTFRVGMPFLVYLARRNKDENHEASHFAKGGNEESRG